MKGSNKNTLNLMAYVAFIAVALLIVINNLLPLLGITVGGTLKNVLETFKNVLVLLVLGIMAFNFTTNCAKWIKILYWIALVIFIAGTAILWVVV